MSKIEALKNVPELNFIGNLQLDEVKEQVETWYAEKFKEITGAEPVLSDAAPERLLQLAIAMAGYQALQYIDAKGKGEMLNTSYGEFLDALAANTGVTRRAAERATALMRFTLAAVQSGAVGIPAGTRIKTEGGLYFNTLDYAEIKAGELTADVMAQAEEAGAESDALPAGAINVLVDPIPYMQSAENITASSGGTDVEDDDSLTERIYLAPSIYSCAGPADAYEYYARAWRNDVADVRITSPAASQVKIYFVLDGGVLPTETECEEMEDYFMDEERVRRPLTDLVTAAAPSEAEYEISLTYYIAESDKNNVASIQQAVNDAVTAFETWQRSLGRDINPTELITRIRQAGAKRVTVTAPIDKKVQEYELAKCTGKTVTYGGLEDD